MPVLALISSDIYDCWVEHLICLHVLRFEGQPRYSGMPACSLPAARLDGLTGPVLSGGTPEAPAVVAAVLACQTLGF